jgi:hypothetical protein
MSLISQLQDENRRFTDVQTSEELQQMVFSHNNFNKLAAGAFDTNPTVWFSILAC